MSTIEQVVSGAEVVVNEGRLLINITQLFRSLFPEKNNLSRSIRTVLRDYGGETPVSKKIPGMNGGRVAQGATPECIEYVLNNFKGPRVEQWRLQHLSRFKELFRERCNVVLRNDCASVGQTREEVQTQASQAASATATLRDLWSSVPGPSEEKKDEEEQDVVADEEDKRQDDENHEEEKGEEEEELEEDEGWQRGKDVQEISTSGARTKSDILLQGLRSAGIDADVIRVDEETGLISAIDVIRIMIPGMESGHASERLDRITDSELTADSGQLIDSSKIVIMKINSRGKNTPVADLKTIVQIIWLLPSAKANAFRSKCATTILRVLGGDVTLSREIEERNEALKTTGEGRQLQEMAIGVSTYVEEERVVKRKRYGPEFLMDASEEMYKAYISAMCKAELEKTKLELEKKKQDQELELEKKKRDQDREYRVHLRSEHEEELRAFSSCAKLLEEKQLFNDRDKIEFGDRVRLSCRMLSNRLSGGHVETSGTVVATPVSQPMIERDWSKVPPPKRPAHARGRETSIHIVAAKMGVSLKDKAGLVGRRLKKLYVERYGEEAGRDIPKHETPFQGKLVLANTYYECDNDLIERAIRDVIVDV